MISRLPAIIEGILQGFGTLTESLFNVGGQMIEGLWKGITSAVSGWFKKNVGGVIKDIKSWFTGKDGFDIHSPSKWSEEVFKNVMRGGVSGVEAAGPELREAFSDAIAQLKSDAEGLDSLNMRSVARACQVALGSLYNYFPSKDDLLLATVESVWRVVNITVNTQQLSQTEIDYLINKVNRELGVAV